MENVRPTKLSFAFSPEDYQILKDIQAHLSPIHGDLSNMYVIRTALRRYRAELMERGQ